MYQKNGQTRRARWRIIVLAACIGTVWAREVLSAEWTRSASISAGEVYSDNVGLDSENENSDLFTTLTPTVSVRGEGARANLDLNAAMQISSLGGGAGELNPLLRATADSELIDDFLFVKVFGRAYESTVDPFQASGDTPLSENENVSTTYSYGVEPSIKQRLGSFATFSASTSWDDQISANDDFDDSSERHFGASLASGPDFSRFSWGVNADYTTTDYENNAGTGQGQDDKYSSIRFPVGYRVSRQWQLTSSVGHEWNDYDAETDSQDDDTWDVGVVWTPNSRTSLNAGYGDRYFDNAPRVSFEHRSKRTAFQVSYDRSLTTARDLRARQADLGADNPFGLPFDPVTGQPLPVAGSSTFLDSGSIIDERLEGSFSVQGNRTRIALTGSRSEQTREDNSEDGTFSDVSLDFSRALSGKVSLNAGVSWEGDEDDDGATSDTMRYRIGLTRTLGANTSVALNYSYSDRDSERPDDSYTENRVYLNFIYTL